MQLRQGREAEAIASWKTALELNPRMYDALYNLGTVLVKAGRRDEARPYLERFIREAPRSRYDADIRRLEPAPERVDRRSQPSGLPWPRDARRHGRRTREKNYPSSSWLVLFVSFVVCWWLA